MTRETYKGRKLKVVKGREGGLTGLINGQAMPTRFGVSEQEVIAQLRRDIDQVERTPINGGYGAYMYAPGTYELCANDHPIAKGTQCQHFYCQGRYS